MPSAPVNPSGGKKKKKGHSFFGHLLHNPATHFVDKTAGDLGNVAVHAPGAILGTGRAVGLDVYDFYRHPGQGAKLSRTSKIAKGSVQSIARDFHHPLRHPGYTGLDILGLIPGLEGLGMLTKAGRASRASRFSRTRILTHKSRTVAEEEALSKARGIAPGKVGRTHKIEIPAAATATPRGAQALGDLIRARTGKTYGKVHKEILRESDILDRLSHGPEATFKQALKDVRSRPARRKAGEDIPRFRNHPIKETNALIRALRLYRPGYIPPNLAGGLTANAIHGSLRPSTVRQGLRLRHTDTAETIRSLMSGGISRSAVEGASGPQAAISTLATGIGESAGKLTDRGPRMMTFLREAHKAGHISDEQVKNLIKNSVKDAKLRRDLVQVVRRAEPEAIKFSRTKGRKGLLAKADRIAAENVFLYKWITGSSAYAARTIAHHPIKTAGASAVGRNTPDVGDVLKKYPEWMAQYVPAGKRGKFPLLAGAQSYSLWSSPVEMAQILKAAAGDTRQLITPLNPVQHAAGVALTHYDPFRQIELKNPSAAEALLFALGTELSGNPYMNFVPKDLIHYGHKNKKGQQRSVIEKGRLFDSKAQRERRLFPRTPEDILMQFLFGSTYRTPVNPEVAAKMARPSSSRSKKKKTYAFKP